MVVALKLSGNSKSLIGIFFLTLKTKIVFLSSITTKIFSPHGNSSLILLFVL